MDKDLSGDASEEKEERRKCLADILDAIEDLGEAASALEAAFASLLDEEAEEEEQSSSDVDMEAANASREAEESVDVDFGEVSNGKAASKASP